jgi:hypothetical protein
MESVPSVQPMLESQSQSQDFEPAPVVNETGQLEMPKINLVLDIPPNAKLVDIPFDRLGSIVGVRNSIMNIPGNLLTSARNVFIKYYREYDDIVETGTSVDKALVLKKIWLLPLILFTHSNGSRQIKNTMKKRIDRLRNGNWDFRLNELAFRILPRAKPRAARDDEEALKMEMEADESRTLKYLEAGRISSAYSFWTSEKVPFQAPTPQIFHALCGKFPEAQDGNLSHEENQRLGNYAIHEDARTYTTPESLGRLIHSLPKMVSHGIDHFRNEHIRQLWGYTVGDTQQDEFRACYTRHINRIMNADIPLQAKPLFSDTEAIAIPKPGSNDIRPIGKITLDRKIASKVLLRVCKNDIQECFSGFQFGCDRMGTEKIVHSFRVGKEIHPDFDCWFPDGRNAFNQSNRRRGLLEALDRIPKVFPFLNMLYGGKSNLWYFGLEDGIETIESSEGSQQGCNLGNLLCGLAFIGLINQISTILDGIGFAKFFVDDGNIFSTFDKMYEVVRFVLEQGKQFGYELHTSKGTYLLGKCGNYQLALERKARLVQLGLDENIIKIHPDDFGDIAEDTTSEYGAVVLGGYIGHDHYIDRQLRAKFASLEKEADQLIQLESLQIRNLLFRWCFCEKVTHILRTTPSAPYLEHFAFGFDNLKKKVLCSNFLQFDYGSLPPSLWKQATFNISDGGLAL